MKNTRRSVGILCLVMALSTASCATPGRRTGEGAGLGAAAGGILGGVLGGGWKGVAIGAVAGAAAGGAIGNYLDKQAQELEKVAETKRVENGILVDLKSDLLFKTGSADLKPAAVTQLNKLGDILAKYPEDRIRVAGYADNVGKADFNQHLSEKRADSVKRVLAARQVKDEQLLIKGFGETNPVASNDSAEGRAKNRRVELIIDIPEDKAKAVEKKAS